MIQPPYLRKNDKIVIVAPASAIDEAALVPAVLCMKNWGLRVALGEHVLHRHYQYAGTDMQRVADLQAAISDPEIKAIVCARGGYGSGRIVDALDFSPLLSQPKWLVGFSDATILHARLSRMQMESIHAAMPLNFPSNGGDNDSTESLCQALFGELNPYTLVSHKLNKQGMAKAVLVGGNLSVLAHLCGTHDAMDTTGRILFIEDVGEHLYHIDRLMTQLQRNGVFSNLLGLVVGSFTKLKDDETTFGQTAHEIIASYVSNLNIPVVFDFPAGHQEPNMALYLGRQVLLSVSADRTLLIY